MNAAANLPDDIETLKAIILAQQEQNARLEALVAAFKQAMFGRKSEKIDPDQFELALEDIETAIALVETEGEANPLVTPTRTSTPRKANLGSLPKHLPRIEEVIEPESTVCDCGHERHVIGEDTSERLDIIPAQFRVIVTRRPKYACRSCEGGIVQAPAACRQRPRWRMSSSVNTPIICRFTGRRRFTAARASISTVRHWRPGSDGRPSRSSRSTMPCWPT
ncbi:hypothetical protein GCM10011315_31600 [Roseovarius pacificus]|nr:hypothetical protein GCM10011315_31600 [Roseovarius pacificus]